MDRLALQVPDDYPERVKARLDQLAQRLWVGRAHLSALVVYGSVARRESRAGSDLNLVVVLAPDDPPAALSLLRDAFRVAFRTGRVEPWLLLSGELPRLCDVFPTKLLDIQAHRDCIYGQDPFVDLTIEWADLRHHVEQELRNQLLRMRRFYLFRGDDAQQLGAQLDTAIASLSTLFAGLLRLSAGATPLPTTSEVFERTRGLLDLEPALVQRLLAHRSGQSSRDLSDEQRLYADVMALLGRAVVHVDRLEPPP